MAPDRRFHTFNDYLRARFTDRVQRVTLSGGLVCGNPDGPENCAYCTEATRLDPSYGRGFPVHEQIRRGVNFSRRKGETAPRIMVTVPVQPGPCPPADHIDATLAAIAAQPGVVLIAYSARPECVSEETMDVLGEYALDRDVWLELDDMPAEWPFARDGAVRVGVQVRFGAKSPDGPAGEPEERAVAQLLKLQPDAVGFVAPVIVDGTVDAARYESGELDEPEIEAFASRVAYVLERIPAIVAVHPVILSQKADQIVGGRWALNRQKVQEAIGRALEESGSLQGARVTP